MKLIYALLWFDKSVFKQNEAAAIQVIQWPATFTAGWDSAEIPGTVREVVLFSQDHLQPNEIYESIQPWETLQAERTDIINSGLASGAVIIALPFDEKMDVAEGVGP